MRIGNLEITVFTDSNTVKLTKHYNNSVTKQIRLNEDDIYSLEFAVKEIKRHLNLR